MTRPGQLASGTVWFAALARGHEQAGDRPVLVVSSHFHLDLTGGALVTVLPVTSRYRSGWLHRVQLGDSSWVITEQLRTIATSRLRRRTPELDPDRDALTDVRRVLAAMLDQ